MEGEQHERQRGWTAENEDQQKKLKKRDTTLQRKD